MSSASCYYPNGNLSTSDFACGSGDGTQCCPNGWSCQDNGLCYLENEDYYGRYTCTDQSWSSSGCPQMCTQDNTASGAEAILDCGNGYCCDANRPDAEGDSSKGCCSTSTVRFRINNRQMINETDTNTSNTDTSNTDNSNSTTSSATESPTSTTSSTTEGPTSTSLRFPLTEGPGGFSDSAAFSTSISFPDSASNTNRNAASSRTSVVLVTSVVTKAGGGSSAVVASKTSVIAESASTSTSTPSPTPAKNKSLGPIIGPAVAVPLAVIALAVLLFFLWRRRKQRRNNYDRTNHANYEPKDPVDMYASQNPKPPELESPDPNKTSAGTGPPSYKGAHTPHTGTYPSSPGLESNFRSSELPGSPAFPTGKSPPMSQGQMPQEWSELPGSPYQPYRRPGQAGV